MPETTEIGHEDVGDATVLVETPVAVDIPPTPEEIAAAQAAEAKADAERPVVQQVQDILQQLVNYKAFAVAKAESVVAKITGVGGAVPAALQDILDQVHAEAK